MKPGSIVRVGAPYAYAFAGVSTLTGTVVDMDDDVLTIKTRADVLVHFNTKFLLFIEEYREAEADGQQTQSTELHQRAP